MGIPAQGGAQAAAASAEAAAEADVGDVLLLRYPAQVILLVDAANLVRQVDSALGLRASGSSSSRAGAGSRDGAGAGRRTQATRELHLAVGLPKRLAFLSQLKRRELEACADSLTAATGAPLVDSERHRLLHVLELLLLQKLNQRDALSGRV